MPNIILNKKGAGFGRFRKETVKDLHVVYCRYTEREGHSLESVRLCFWYIGSTPTLFIVHLN